MPVQQPQKSQKWCTKTPKSVQNEVQTSTWNHQIHEKVKKVKSNEILRFIIRFIGWDIRNQQSFHSKSMENHACNPNMFFGASNCRKYQKVTQIGVWGGTQNASKIHENPSWYLPGSIWVHLWLTWLQNGAQMVPKDLQKDPKWSSGDPKRS